jgi:hypothetical protein
MGTTLQGDEIKRSLKIK